jgi:hypothetical protein
MSELSVYKQLTFGTKECLDAIKREIGMKTTCMPFAVKLIGALNTLELKKEENELNAANVLLSGLQTLMQGGIVAEDYDKIDFVKRGNTIVPSARVEAFYRAAARKGYRITDTIIAVPKEDFETTYFKENFYNGDIVYTVEDRRINSDRTVTAQRLVDGYFSKFICRLDIHDVKQNKRVVMVVCEMSNDDMLNVAAASEQGLYKSRWEEYTNKWGKKANRKVITNELNTDTFWIKWTGEMINKSIIRRALKRVKEVLPELTDSIYAFEQDEYVEENNIVDVQEVIDIPVECEDVNLRKLTAEQTEDCKEILELWTANPKLAEDKLAEIKQMIESGKTAQEIINTEYASIAVLQKSKTKWAEIGGYFNEKS